MLVLGLISLNLGQGQRHLTGGLLTQGDLVLVEVMMSSIGEQGRAHPAFSDHQRHPEHGTVGASLGDLGAEVGRVETILHRDRSPRPQRALRQRHLSRPGTHLSVHAAQDAGGGHRDGDPFRWIPQDQVATVGPHQRPHLLRQHLGHRR